ncbi:DNL zinc finger-domain-containing protein [Absidia repens]|uniref:DNL zinc finger-domain-containing protein n=1 Tax=Absidia repens TaxID=90262 RepID=A0A1X2IWD4_9FUNG|nr:DNL zinc finger-domain-containing protein [Absidia repens]
MLRTLVKPQRISGYQKHLQTRSIRSALHHRGFVSLSWTLQQQQHPVNTSNSSNSGSSLFLLQQKRKLHHSPSCWHETPPSQTEAQEPEEQVLDPKHQLLIGFTCKVCEVRSHHVMSKHAYTKGVVLIQCPDCKNRHLIADNLGWFKDTKTNVEDLVKEKGEAIRKVVVDEQGNKLPVEHLMEWVPTVAAEEEQRIKEANDKARQLREKEKENDDV